MNKIRNFWKKLKYWQKGRIVLVRERDLKKGSIEYKLSLIIDNMLVIERMSK